MHILLRLPTHKKVATESKPLNAQKGSTCWYYASRLVREFHHLTSHWNPDADSQVEKAISGVRKFETKIDAVLEKIGDRVPNERELAAIKGILDDLMKDRPIPAREWAEKIKEFYANTPRKGRDQLFDLLRTWNSYSKLGASTSEGIWEKYGFKFQDGDMDANTLSLRIWCWGPLLASGDFCTSGQGERDVSLAGRATVRHTTAFVAGDHVIVLCGVGILDDAAAVFYHDPNDPAVCRSMPYATYSARRNRSARIGMISCGEFNCVHITDSTVIGTGDVVRK